MNGILVLLSLLATIVPLTRCSIVSSNPFLGYTLYVPFYHENQIDTSIALHPSESAYYERVKTIPIAFWIDKIATIKNATDEFAYANNLQQQSSDNYAIVTVIYDLPHRDCAAAASHGEIDCEDSDCTEGLTTYRDDYIDPVYELLASYPDLRFILILEPDSLPNIATNLDVAKCTEAQTAYETGIAYAIEKFSFLDNVAIYIDAAHGGWLGWDDNQQAFAEVIGDVLDYATDSMTSNQDYSAARVDGSDVSLDSNFHASQLVRGFSSNVAGYQPTGCLSCTDDPCGLESQFNDCINEVIYANEIRDDFVTYAGFDSVQGWIIDTSRNGVIDARSDCSNWCNIEGSGLGYPTQSGDNVTLISESSFIDAFVWVKVPGESDGTSDTSADRYDSKCGSADSLDDAPEAGHWFDGFFTQLVDNADPSIKALTVVDDSSDGDNGNNNDNNNNDNDNDNDSDNESSNSGSSSDGDGDSTLVILLVIVCILLVCLIIFAAWYLNKMRKRTSVNVNDPVWAQQPYAVKPQFSNKNLMQQIETNQIQAVAAEPTNGPVAADTQVPKRPPRPPPRPPRPPQK